MSEEIIEIRDYTVELEWFDAYKKWLTEFGAPIAFDNLDIIGFWVDDGIEPEVAGSRPFFSLNGQANVSWIIRWPSQAARAEGWKAFGRLPDWKEAWPKHPNPDAYLQMNARFMKSALGASLGSSGSGVHSAPESGGVNSLSGGIVEIRDYTIEPEWFDACKKWAAELGVPAVRDSLDVVEITFDDGIESEVSGSAPCVSPSGQPNTCWIYRWSSLAARNEGLKALTGNPSFQKVIEQHPNPDAYLHVNVRFMKAVEGAL